MANSIKQQSSVPAGVTGANQTASKEVTPRRPTSWEIARSPQVVIAFSVFAFFMYFELPLIRERPAAWNALIAGGIFFPAAGFLMPYVSRLVPVYNTLKPKQQLEWDNRIVSFILDLSCAVPSVIGFFNLGCGVSSFERILAVPTFEMDSAAGWITAYDTYDVLVAVPIYGRGAFTVILHHALQLFVFYSYISDPYGVVFMIGGGIMLASSGILHIQRILSLAGVNPKSLFSRALNYVLIISWVFCRFVVWFYLIWNYAWVNVASVSFNLGCNLVVSFAFSYLNFVWLQKMVNMKDISF